MVDGIVVKVLGDYGPFSRIGKSIGYQVTIGQSSYLVDCGAPLFQQLGGHKLKAINGLIVTHCHDDHKRWFSDYALFNRYAPDISNKLCLLTSEGINEELIKASGPALDRSLSYDSKNVIDIAYEDYVDYKIIGPLAKYRVISRDEGNGKSGLSVIDRTGKSIGPDRAKIVVSNKTGRPRMLFKDPNYGEWVEPENFYTFSSEVFYENNRNIYANNEGFKIEAIKAPVWHGISGIGIKFITDGETLTFSSDTVHDRVLWEQPYSEKRAQKLSISRKEFEAASILYGNINDYVERIWSEERFAEAINSFHGSVVIHDIAVRNIAVHTDYSKLKSTVLKKNKVILTHSPDTMTSEWALSEAEKCFKIKGNTFFEVVGDELYPLNADVYHKEAGKYYVGYKNTKGSYVVYEKNGVLSLSSNERLGLGTPLYRVDLYEDIAGNYFPKLENNDAEYRERTDGRIELVRFTDEGSSGKIVENERDRLVKKDIINYANTKYY